MKIALFTDSFLPGVGGTENAVLNFANTLAKENEVMLFAPKYSREFDDNAYDFKIIRAKSIKITDNDFWAMPRSTKTIKKALDEFKPDILHSHTMGMMAGYANGYAKKHNIPSILTAHTKYGYCYRDALKSNLLSKIVLKHIIRRANNASRVCSCSYSMIDELKSYGGKKEVTVIKNGVIRDLNQYTKPELTGDFTFLYVGLISTFKNIEFSLRALSLVKKTRKDFKFKIIGQGPDIKKLTKKAKKLGLENNVEFIGVVRDRNLLNDYYANADLFLFPSIFDNDPLVVIESANRGTPALVLENTGASERLTDRVTGFISKPDETSFAQKILSLMNDRELIRKVGQNSDSINSSWEQATDKYINVYKEELAK